MCPMTTIRNRLKGKTGESGILSKYFLQENRLCYLIYGLVILVLVVPGCINKKKYQDEILSKEIVFGSQLGEIKFNIEIFDTEASRELGLMHRRSMPEDHGALFVFPTSKHHVFWMKNTYLSLDLIFFDEDFFVVGIIENTTPLSLDHLGIDKMSRYVLEVLAGTVKRYGINMDTSVYLVKRSK